MQRKPKSITWSVKQVCTMIDKETITFDNPLQRPHGQWTQADATELIDSTLTMFVPDVLALQVKQEKGNIWDMIDGGQRLTYIHGYVNDKWSLEELESFILETTNEEHNISGLKFSELPEEVKDSILGYSLTFKYVEITEDDDEEAIVRKIIRRMNKGTRMSGEHLALVSAKKNVQEFVARMIKEHPLFTDVAKYSDKAILKSDKQMTILQSIVYVSKLDFDTFAAKDIEKFFMANDISDEVLNRTEELFNAISDIFNDERNKFCTKINISSMVGFLNSQEDMKQAKEFITWYANNSKPGDVYKINTGAGSTKKEKVNGRITGLNKLFEDWKEQVKVQEVA